MLINGMPFVNDPEALGKWEFVALTSSIESYDGKESPFDSEKAFREVYFLAEGKGYCGFEGWTKGTMLFWSGGKDLDIAERRYEICDCNGERRMFMQTQDDPNLYIVLKKTSDAIISSDSEIGRRDNINFPFISDDTIIGSWLPVDFVRQPDDFNPQKKWDYLPLQDMTFYPDGTVIRHYLDATGKIEWVDTWTNGMLLDKKHRTANHYEFHIVNNTEYLFMQWKMNNYVFHGEEPYYYVFKRK